MDLAIQADELRRRGARKPVELAKTWRLLERLAHDEFVEAPQRLLADLLHVAKEKVRRQLRALVRAGVLVLERAGDMACRTPALFRLRVRFSAGVAYVSRSVSTSGVGYVAPTHDVNHYTSSTISRRVRPLTSLDISDDFFGDISDVMTPSVKANAIKSDASDVVVARARGKPAAGTDDAADETDFAALARRSGRGEEQIERDLCYLRRHHPVDRIRLSLQSVALKRARGRFVRDEARLFWFLMRNPNERGEEGACCSRREFADLLAHEQQATPSLPVVAFKTGPAPAPEARRPVDAATLAALALPASFGGQAAPGQAERAQESARPPAPLRAVVAEAKAEVREVPSSVLQMRATIRAEVEEIRRLMAPISDEEAARRKVAFFAHAKACRAKQAAEKRTPPSPPPSIPVGEDEAKATARKVYQQARLEHAEAELRALAAGRPLPPPPELPAILSGLAKPTGGW